MASLTVRQLDEKLKKRLRLRAAKSGRSVEDEVRTILREAAEQTDDETRTSVGPVAAPTSSTRTARPPPPDGAKRVLLIIGGGIAAYKSLDLIRRLMERRIAVRGIMTKAAEHFVTPLSASALVGERVFTNLFDPASEFDVGHIRLARETDLIVVAPATADLMAKLAGGHHRRAAGNIGKNTSGTSNEPAHVGKRGDTTQSGAIECRRHRARWSE